MPILNFRIVDIHLLSILLIVIIIISTNLKKYRQDNSTKLFLFLCISILFMLVTDLMTCLFNGVPGDRARQILYISHSTYYALITLPGAIFINYIDLLINNSMERIKKRLFYLFPLFLSCIITITTLSSEFIFSINDANLYIRGTGVYVLTVIGWLPALFVLAMSYRNRRGMNIQKIITITSFAFAPLVGNIIQIAFPGTSMIFPAVSISLLMLYIFLEVKDEQRDYLTGLLSRQSIDVWLRLRINQFDKSGGFSLIILDLDNFKKINDEYGHKEGDSVLIIISNLLTRMVKSTDKVARFGGDEFIIIAENDDYLIVKEMLRRIHKQLEKNNQKRKSSYDISFSAGYAVYNPGKHRDVSELFHDADERMYLSKQNRAKGTFAI